MTLESLYKVCVFSMTWSTKNC